MRHDMLMLQLRQHYDPPGQFVLGEAKGTLLQALNKLGQRESVYRAEVPSLENRLLSPRIVEIGND